MRGSQFRGITLHIQRDTPCVGQLSLQAPMLVETYTTWRPNEKIFRCQPPVSFLQEILKLLVQKPSNARMQSAKLQMLRAVTL